MKQRNFNRIKVGDWVSIRCREIEADGIVEDLYTNDTGRVTGVVVDGTRWHREWIKEVLPKSAIEVLDTLCDEVVESRDESGVVTNYAFTKNGYRKFAAYLSSGGQG